MFRDFITNAADYLDPTQLHALAHVSRLTAKVARDRCSRPDVNPAIQQEVARYVNKAFLWADTVAPRAPYIRDMRLLVFEQHMTRALSRSSVTMFAGRRSLYLSDVPEWLAYLDTEDNLSQLTLAAACSRDDFKLAMIALDRLAATHYMENRETPPSLVHMMGYIAPLAYPTVSDSQSRYVRRYDRLYNKTSHGRIFTYLARHGFLTEHDITHSICAANDTETMRMVLANGYHFDHHRYCMDDIPVSDQMYEVVRHDQGGTSRRYMSRDHIILDDDAHFSRTTFPDPFEWSNMRDISTCERVIAQTPE